MTTFTKDDVEKAREIAKLLANSFVWRETEEGYEFWDNVYVRLIKISRSTSPKKGATKRSKKMAKAKKAPAKKTKK